MKKFLCLLMPLTLLAEVFIQNSWDGGPGILVTDNWDGFWKGDNVDPFHPDSLKLLKTRFIPFNSNNAFGDTGSIVEIRAYDYDRILVGVNSDSGYVYYSENRTFSPSQRISFSYPVKNFEIYGNLCFLTTTFSYAYKIQLWPPQETRDQGVDYALKFVDYYGEFYTWIINNYKLKYFDGFQWLDATVMGTSQEEPIDLWANENFISGLVEKISGGRVYWNVYHWNGGSVQPDIAPQDTSVPFRVVSGTDGVILVATNSPPKIYRKLRADTLWTITFNDTTIFRIQDLFQMKDGYYFLLAKAKSGFPPINRVYFSYDGIEWKFLASTDSILPNRELGVIRETERDEPWLGLSEPPDILTGKYSKSGVLNSSFLRISSPQGYTLFISFTSSTQDSVLIKARTTMQIQDTVPWDSIPYLQDTSLVHYPWVKDGDTLFQYRAEFQNPFLTDTPYLHWVRLNVSYDTSGPKLISACADDYEEEWDGKDRDDRVYLVFDEPTNKPLIDTSNINSFFPLSGGHTWWDSTTFIFGGAEWNEWGDTLVIGLSYGFDSGIVFSTVEVGDTVYAMNIQDRFGYSRTSSKVVTCTFDDIKGPTIKKAIASDGSNIEDGIDDDDYLLVIFSEPTNRPNINSSNINSILPLSSGHFYGDSILVSWSPQSPWDDETLRINLFPYGNPTVAKGDTMWVDSSSVWDGKGQKAWGFAIIEGTFDEKVPSCDSAIASDNLNPGGGIDDDDFVVLYFSEPVRMKMPIDAQSIDQAFRLSSGHTWLSGDGKIENIIVDNPDGFYVLYVLLDISGGEPTVSVGDSVFFSPLYLEDIAENALLDTVIIGGSFGPVEIKEKVERFPEPIFIPKNTLWEKDIPIVFSFSKPERVSLAIFDVSGREVDKRVKLLKGQGTLSISVEKLPPGVYFLSVEFSRQKYILKGIKLR